MCEQSPLFVCRTNQNFALTIRNWLWRSVAMLYQATLNNSVTSSLHREQPKTKNLNDTHHYWVLYCPLPRFFLLNLALHSSALLWSRYQDTTYSSQRTWKRFLFWLHLKRKCVYPVIMLHKQTRNTILAYINPCVFLRAKDIDPCSNETKNCSRHNEI